MTVPGISLELADDKDWNYVLDCLVEAYYADLGSPDSSPKPRDQVLKEMRYYLDPHARDGLKNRLLRRGKKPPHEAFIARDERGERAGCLLLGVNLGAGARTAWVYLVYVEPRHRGRGVAKWMMAWAEKWAKEKGMNAIMLKVSAGNRAAINVYESAGLVPDKVWMKKRL